LLLGLARSWLHLDRLRRSLLPVADETLHGVFEEAQRLLGVQRLGVGRLPKIAVSNKIPTPVAAGFFHPVVVLPAGALGAINSDQLRDVLVHEMAHVLRGDHLVVLCQSIAKIVLWPIVFVHMLNRQLSIAREEVCDNYVLAGRDAVSYSETLLRFAELSRRRRPISVWIGIMDWNGKLNDRIAGLMDKRRDTMTRTNRLTAVATMGVFAVATVIVCGTTFVDAQVDA